MAEKFDPVRDQWRKRMSRLSDRTFTTFWTTFKQLVTLERKGAITKDEIREAILDARWKDGKLNVIQFQRNAVGIFIKVKEERPELFRKSGEAAGDMIIAPSHDKPMTAAEVAQAMRGESKNPPGKVAELRPEPAEGSNPDTSVRRVLPPARPERDYPGLDREAWRVELIDVSKGTFEAFWVSYRKLAALERDGIINEKQMNAALFNSYESNGAGKMNVTRFRTIVADLMEIPNEQRPRELKSKRASSHMRYDGQSRADPSSQHIVDSHTSTEPESAANIVMTANVPVPEPDVKAAPLWVTSKDGTLDIALGRGAHGKWNVGAFYHGTKERAPVAQGFEREEEARAYANELWATGIDSAV